MLDPIFENIPNIKNSTSASIPQLDVDQLNEKTFIKEFVEKNQPCLIKGAIKHWPATNLWKKKEYLIKNCSKTHKTFYFPHMNYTTWDKMKEGKTEKKFSDIIELLHSTEDTNKIISVPTMELTKDGPYSTIYNDVKDFTFLHSPPNPLGYPKHRCFLYKGAGTGWHLHHADETLMCQIHGTKKVAMLQPDTFTNNIVHDAFTNETYLENKDLFKHKDVDNLKPIVIEVNVGDALYIPPFWWHAVVPIDNDFGITLAHCWRSPLHIMGNLSYPAVREIWKNILSPPHRKIFIVPLLGSISIIAQIIYKLNTIIRK